LEERPAVWEEAGLQGRYANCFRVGYNAFEFMIDFAQSASDNRVAQLHTRIIINPAYSRTLLEVLRQSIEEYERAYGPVTGEHTT
jgi:hypothetical protein